MAGFKCLKCGKLLRTKRQFSAHTRRHARSVSYLDNSRARSLSEEQARTNTERFKSLWQVATQASKNLDKIAIELDNAPGASTSLRLAIQSVADQLRRVTNANIPL